MDNVSLDRATEEGRNCGVPLATLSGIHQACRLKFPAIETQEQQLEVAGTSAKASKRAKSAAGPQASKSVTRLPYKHPVTAIIKGKLQEVFPLGDPRALAWDGESEDSSSLVFGSIRGEWTVIGKELCKAMSSALSSDKEQLRFWATELPELLDLLPGGSPPKFEHWLRLKLYTQLHQARAAKPEQDPELNPQPAASSNGSRGRGRTGRSGGRGGRAGGRGGRGGGVSQGDQLLLEPRGAPGQGNAMVTVPGNLSQQGGNTVASVLDRLAAEGRAATVTVIRPTMRLGGGDGAGARSTADTDYQDIYAGDDERSPAPHEVAGGLDGSGLAYAETGMEYCPETQICNGGAQQHQQGSQTPRPDAVTTERRLKAGTWLPTRHVVAPREEQTHTGSGVARVPLLTPEQAYQLVLAENERPQPGAQGNLVGESDKYRTPLTLFQTPPGGEARDAKRARADEGQHRGTAAATPASRERSQRIAQKHQPSVTGVVPAAPTGVAQQVLAKHHQRLRDKQLQQRNHAVATYQPPELAQLGADAYANHDDYGGLT